MKISEITQSDRKEPVVLKRVWDNADSYPWGPRGENQRQLEIKNKAVWWAEKHAREQMVNYDDLTSIEDSVYPDRVLQYVEHPPTHLPFVYSHNGKLILWDGTHRVSARIRSGYTSGPCMVADLDQVLTWDGKVKDPAKFTS